MKLITITGIIKRGRKVEIPIGNMPLYRFEILCSKSGNKFPVDVYEAYDIDSIVDKINKGERTIEVELASYFKNGYYVIVMKFRRFKGDFTQYVASGMFGEIS